MTQWTFFQVLSLNKQMNLFRLFGEIVVDNTEANTAINETANRASESSTKVDNSFSKIGSAAVTAGKWIAGSAVALGGSMLAITESTREYRTEMGKLETAFTSSGHTSESATQTFMTLNGVLGDSGVATEAAQHLALLTDNEKDLQTWTDICTGVYATFGSSLPIESLTEAANHTAKVGEVQSVLADALEWSGRSVDEFNEELAACSTEQERQQLITSTLNEIYSESAEKYKEVNADIIAANEANAKLTDAFSELGKVFEPIVTAIKEKVAEMVEAATPKIQELIDKIKDVKKWIKENEDTIQTWIGVILGATVAIGTFLLILNWGAIMSAAASALNAVRTAVMLFNAALMANPIGIVVALIAGLVVAFIYLWNNCEPFREFWINLWKSIKDTASSAIEKAKQLFSDMKESMEKRFNEMRDKGSDAFQKLKSNIIDPIVSAKSKVVEVFGSIKSTITEKINAARDAVSTAINKIKGFFDISLKFKAIKMPTISVSWSKSPAILAKAAELLDIPGVPKFSVKWNAEGAIIKKAGIVGRAGDTLLGAGENGDEAIAPIDILQEYVRSAVRSEIGDIIDILQNIREYMPQILQKNTDVYLNGETLVSGIAHSMDAELGHISRQKYRGNI